MMDTRKLANSLPPPDGPHDQQPGPSWEIGSVDFYVINNNPQP